MSKARPVKASMPVHRAAASMSRRTLSKLVEQVLAVVDAVGSRRRSAGAGSARPGPFGVNGRCAMPRKPGSVPRDMPRRLTNGGTSCWPLPRSFETTEPNDG